jgi:hypothetical protein
MSMSLDRLAAQAPPEAVALARAILEQALTDARWAERIGPVLSQADVARLLDKTVQAVAQDQRLLRLRQRDGRPVYPIFQFEGRRQLGGVAEVVATLRDAVEPLTIAAWLNGPNRRFGGRRPVELLRKGETDDVLAAARRYARTAG